MSKELKPLEALKELDKQVFSVNNTEKYNECLDIIEKSLKALEIIKRFNTAFYIYKTIKPFISKEEDKLLKEVLL